MSARLKYEGRRRPAEPTVHEHSVVAGKKGDHTGNVFWCGRPAGREALAKGVQDASLFSSSAVASGEVRLGATALMRTPRDPYGGVGTRQRYDL